MCSEAYAKSELLLTSLYRATVSSDASPSGSLSVPLLAFRLRGDDSSEKLWEEEVDSAVLSLPRDHRDNTFGNNSSPSVLLLLLLRSDMGGEELSLSLRRDMGGEELPLSLRRDMGGEELPL